jgi:hypothetical protein
MAKPEVLSRVDADLRRGHTRLAARRLIDLLSNDPQDLEIRARLADTCRRTGDIAEAGRWAFLTEDAEPHEIEAFARKYRSAADRLRLLRLRGEDARGLGPLAEPRWTGLLAAAEAEPRPEPVLKAAGKPRRIGPVPRAATVMPWTEPIHTTAGDVPADDPLPVDHSPPKLVVRTGTSGRSFWETACLLMMFGFPVVGFCVTVCVVVYQALTSGGR